MKKVNATEMRNVEGGLKLKWKCPKCGKKYYTEGYFMQAHFLKYKLGKCRK